MAKKNKPESTQDEPAEKALSGVIQGRYRSRSQGTATTRPTVPGIYAAFIPGVRDASFELKRAFGSDSEGNFNCIEGEQLPDKNTHGIDEYELIIYEIHMKDLSTAPYGAWTYLCELPSKIDERGDNEAAGYKPAGAETIGQTAEFSQNAFGPWFKATLVHIADPALNVDCPHCAYDPESGAYQSFAYCRVPIEETRVERIEPPMDIRALIQASQVEELVPLSDDGIDTLPVTVMATKPEGWSVKCTAVARYLRPDGRYLYDCVSGKKRAKFLDVRHPTPEEAEKETSENEFVAICGKRFGHDECQCAACSYMFKLEGYEVL